MRRKKSPAIKFCEIRDAQATTKTSRSLDQQHKCIVNDTDQEGLFQYFNLWQQMRL